MKVELGNIKGPKGAQGDKGEKGDSGNVDTSVLMTDTEYTALWNTIQK